MGLLGVDEEPGFGDLAIRQAKDGRLVVDERSAQAFTAIGCQRDGSLVVRQDVVELDTKRPVGLLEQRAKETEDIVAPGVVARETALTEGMPDDVIGKRLPDRLQVARGEGRVRSAEQVFVAMRLVNL